MLKVDPIGMRPESNAPSAAVTVCTASSSLLHVTVVPRRTVAIDGWKLYCCIGRRAASDAACGTEPSDWPKNRLERKTQSREPPASVWHTAHAADWRAGVEYVPSGRNATYSHSPVRFISYAAPKPGSLRMTKMPVRSPRWYLPASSSSA